MEARFNILPDRMPPIPTEKMTDAQKKVAADIPMGRMGETAEAANAIVFLASNLATYVTGTSLNLDGGLSGVL